MRVSPEPGAVELLRRYNVALNYALQRILSLDLRGLKDVHNALYRGLLDFHLGLLLTAIGMSLQMQRLGEIILGRVNALGLGSSACYYTRDRDIELERAMLRS